MRWSTSLVGLTLLTAVSSTLAQNMPRPHHGDGGDGGMDQHDGHGPPPDGGPGGPDGGPGGGPGGPGGPGGGPGGEDGPGGDHHGGPGGPAGPKRSIGAMTSYIDLVTRYTKLSDDASSAGVSAVVSLTEVLRPSGTQAVIDELNKLLLTVKDATVARAIRLQLIDFYRASNQTDKAVAQAEMLITGPSASTQPSQ